MFNKKKEKKYDPVDDLIRIQGEIIELMKEQQKAIRSLEQSVEALQKLAEKQEL